MSKKPCFRTPFDSQNAEGSPTLLKSARQHFYHTFYHYEGNSVGKCLSWWHLKSYNFLLTHWLSMTSILFVIVRIYRNRFKCNYLRNKKFFLKFFLHVWNLDQIFNIWKQKITIIADAFSKLRTGKDVVR